MNLFLLAVSPVGREFFDAIDSIRQLSLILQWRFPDPQWLSFRWRFLVSSDAVLVTIPCVTYDYVFSIDFIRQPWISLRCRFRSSAVTQFQTWFLVLQWLNFRRRFLDQHWHRGFDDSMRQTRIYFCYWFHASLVNSLTLSTPYVSCHSYYSGDFRV
jgi:hypothetical protein